MKKPPAFLLTVLVLVVSLLLVFLDPLKVVQWKLSDLMFRSRTVSDQITLVAIDDKSLSQEAGLGRFSDWPRSYYAQLLQSLSGKEPAVLAFDLVFRDSARGISDLRLKQLLREQERTSAVTPGVSLKWYDLLKRFEGKEHPDDADFQAAINDSGVPVILTSSLLFATQNAGEARLEDGTFPEPASVVPPLYSGERVFAGYLNALRDRDSVLRRFTPKLSESNVSFPLAIARAFNSTRENKTLNEASILDGLMTRIAYATKPGLYATISFVDALSGNFDPALIKDKIVIIGATARALQDIQITPTSRDPMPGVEVNAQIVQQLIEGRFLAEQGRTSVAFVCIFLSIVGVIVFLRVQLKAVALVLGGVLVLIPVAAYGLYQTGYIANVVYPEFTWIFAALAALWYRNETEFKEKKAIKNAFSHYVSPVVVNELTKDPASLKLGGKRQEITVLFSDIVGFTSIAEKLTPEDTVALLNDYLTAMTEVVFGYQGTLDKYQGDAVMALFGAPLADRHHALNACNTAIAMRKALIALHEKWNGIQNLPFKDELITLDFRVGIASGPAVVGNVGSEKRFDYTAIGDIVNLGSRLESLNKKYGTRVIVDKATFVAITENHNPFVFRQLDTVRVKGKKQATDVFEVVGFMENVNADTKAMLDDFENGRLLYTQRNFIDAKQYFEAALARVSNDSPSQIYLNRCNFFLRKPPGRDWSPIVDLEEK